MDFGDSIRNFRVETKFNADKSSQGAVKKFVYFEYFEFIRLS
jgi:hypothetical protein